MNQPLTNQELRAAAVRVAIRSKVAAPITVSNLPLSLRSGRIDTANIYNAGQILADQTGAAAVLTFTFTNPMHSIWVRSDGGDVRCDPFGGAPAAAAGIVCKDGVPLQLTIMATVILVYAPAGAVVKCWGYRYTA